MLIRKELVHGLRVMRRHPAFTSAAVVTLALAIATTVLIFEVIDSVALRSLPVKDPGTLVILQWKQHKPLSPQMRQQWSGFEENASFSYPFFLAIQHSNILSSVFGFTPVDTTFTRATIEGREVSPRGEAITTGYFAGLGIQPLIGHLISNEVGNEYSNPVVNISYAFWTREFGRDPAAIGKTISFHHVPYSIIGVTPPDFSGTESGQAPDFWVPVQQWRETSGSLLDHTNWWLTIMGRLETPRLLDKTRLKLELLFWRELESDIGGRLNPSELPRIRLVSGRRGIDLLQNELGRPAKILGLIGLLAFLIAAANVGILMLARALARDREISVRLSLGSPRRSIIRQFFLESFLVAGAGGLIGLLLAYASNRTIAGMLARMEPLTDLQISLVPGFSSISFGAGLIFLTAIVCGTIPACHAATRAPSAALRGSDAPGKTVSRKGRVSELLVTAQLTFAVLLVLISGLLIRTVQNLEHQDLGFNANDLLLLSVNGTKAGYRGAALSDLYERLQQRLAAVPGIESVSSSTMTMGSTTALALPVSVPGRPQSSTAEPTFIDLVGPEYFRTMQMPLVQGRGLNLEDMGGPKVAVINQAMAQRYFSGENPVGKSFAIGGFNVFEVAGIVRNIKGSDLRDNLTARIYLPFPSMIRELQASPDGLFFELRTKGKPELVVASVRGAITAVDPKLKARNIMTQIDQIDAAAVVESTLASVTSFLGFLVLLLTAISVYANQSYAVAQRTREIGVRISLGASRGKILVLVLRRFCRVLLPGLAIGLVLAFGVARLFSKEFYQVQATDGMTAIISVVIVTLMCLIGGLIPAWRAISVDPAVALHYE